MTRQPSSGSATGPCCCATAVSRSTGRSTRRSPGTAGPSPRTATDRGASRTGGTRDGEPRERFLAGEPFGLEIEVAGAAAAASLHLEIRDGSGLLVAEEILDPRSLGANGGADGTTLRFDVASPPLQFGRFDVGLALVGEDGRLLDRLPRGVPLLVYPDGEGRGLVRLEGTWRRDAKEADR